MVHHREGLFLVRKEIARPFADCSPRLATTLSLPYRIGDLANHTEFRETANPAGSLVALPCFMEAYVGERTIARTLFGKG